MAHSKGTSKSPPVDPVTSPQAIATLLESFRDTLLLMAEHRLDRTLRPKLDAADVVQETLILANAGFTHFQGGSRSELAHWLHTILRHVLADHRRRFETEKRDCHREQGDTVLLERLPSRDRTPSSHCRHQEDEAMVRKILECLPEEIRELLQWRHWDEATWEEIGRRLHKSRPHVRKLYERAVAHLRTVLMR